tara:strand:+ start:330 stop:1028 length:699 start_codon:yes stop_codon:yes gene_type:complete
MKYPVLPNTPIKEIIFSISYDEIVDKDCFEKFVNLDFIKNRYSNIKPSVTNQFKITDKGINVSNDNSGFHLKNNNEVLQMRKGSLSYHFLHEYCSFDKILDILIKLWSTFDNVTKDNLTVNDISVRYINVIEVDNENPVSELIQLYPKQSKKRNIVKFQNSVTFSYTDEPEYIVNAVSTQPKENLVLLDISVNKNIKKNKIDLAESFKPLRVIKNRVFFDSITAKALLKYSV